MLLGFFLVLQEASQQRVAAFKAAAHLSKPVRVNKDRKTVNLNAFTRSVDTGLHATSADAGHARSESHDISIIHPAAGHARSALTDTKTNRFSCKDRSSLHVRLCFCK